LQRFLIIKLRQDESLDSPSSLESVKTGSIMPSNPIIGQVNACLYAGMRPQLRGNKYMDES